MSFIAKKARLDTKSKKNKKEPAKTKRWIYAATMAQHAERRDRDPNVVINVYRFPNSKLEKAERQRWIDVVGKINANLVVEDETVVWPVDFVYNIGDIW